MVQSKEDIISIIGEATKKLSDEFKQRYPQIEWRAIGGMRDKLIHSYFGVDYDLKGLKILFSPILCVPC